MGTAILAGVAGVAAAGIAGYAIHSHYQCMALYVFFSFLLFP